MSRYNRYTGEDYRKILAIYADCGSINHTARLTKYPRTTVNRIIKKYETVEQLEALYDFESDLPLVTRIQQNQDMQLHYAYVLGLYLGDGHISKTNSHRAERVMIFLDKAYPNIIKRCEKSLGIVFPNNEVGIVDKKTFVYVNCYSQQLPELFPQHGEGKKHDRDIILEEWQERIVDAYPLEFFRGLYHSDGSRAQNIVKGKNYPRYMFSNYSDDIRKLFTDTAEKLGLTWTTANARNVAISRREDVAWLDEHIGEKS
ncbi:MAG: helix-turn-helix domain-containing protein [Chloroflexota bacterium]